MNTPRRIFRIPLALAAALLAVASLLGSLAPAASAQAVPGAVLATQFLGSITGEGTGYQLSSDAVLHTPEGDFAGHAGLVAYGDDLAAAFTFLTFSVENAAQAGDLVIVSLTITGVNTGSYQGLAANCAGISAPAVAVLRVSDQVVVEQWIDYDRAQIARQIEFVNLLDPGDRPGCSATVAYADGYATDQLPPYPQAPNSEEPF